MSNITRVLLAGDTHHDTPWMVHLIHTANRLGIKRIIQVGDFGYFPGEDWGDAFIKTTSNVAQELGIEVEFLDGNHDNHKALAELERDELGRGLVAPNVAHLPRGHRFEIEGVSFLAVGGAVSIDAASRVEGVNWWREERLSYREVDTILTGERVDVLLTHDAPEEVAGSWWTKSDAESAGHRRMISAIAETVAPKLLIHGHYHHGHMSEYAHDNGTTTVVGLGKNTTPGDENDQEFQILELPSLVLN